MPAGGFASLISLRGVFMAYAEIRLVVGAGAGADERELAGDVADLRRLLLRQGVEEARPDRGAQVPPGAKAGDGVVLGVLLVTLAPHVFGAVVAAVQAWSARASGRSVEIVEGERSLTVSGLSERQQRELVEDFRRRTAAVLGGVSPDDVPPDDVPPGDAVPGDGAAGREEPGGRP